MTISSETRKAGPSPGNGAATAFPFAFKVFAKADVSVTLTVLATGVQTLLTLDTDYTIALNADQNASPGGTVTYNPSGVPMPATKTLTIGSVVTKTQGTDITNGGAFLPNIIEDMVDRTTIEIQQEAEKVTRSLKFPIVDGTLTSELPPAAQRANYLLGFDASGNVTAVIPSAQSAAALQVDLLNSTDDTKGATMIGFKPAAGILASTVRAALLELDSEHTAYVASLAASGGSGLVGFLQAGGGATARTVQHKLRDTISVKDFGAVGDGATDDTAAIQAALDAVPATGGTLYFPAGTYKLTATLTGANKPISLAGDGLDITVLKWSGVAMTGLNGITWTNTQQIPFIMMDMSIVAVPNAAAATVLAGVGVSVTYPNQQTNVAPTVRLMRVSFRWDYTGNTWAPVMLGGWTTCVDLQDAGIANITDCVFVCNVNTSVTFGVKLHGLSGNPDYVVMSACAFFGFATCVYASGPASLGGFIFSTCEFVSCNVAVNMDIASDLIQMTDCYTLAYSQGVITNARTSKISGSRFDLDADPRGRYAPATREGIVLGNGVISLDGHSISDCNFGGAGSNKRGIRVTSGVTLSNIHDNTFGAIAAYGTVYAAGVVLEAGSTSNVVTNNVKVNCTTLVTDAGTGNLVRSNGQSEGAMNITGAIPSLKSGTGGTTLDKLVYLTQAGATNVTNFTNGYIGQEIRIIAGDGLSTIVASATLRINGGVNFTMAGNNMLGLIFDGASWHETGRHT